MSAIQRQSGRRMSLTVTLVLLAVYYAAVFRPLAQREHDQVQPFENMQSELRAAATNNLAISGLSLDSLNRLAASLRDSLTNVARAREVVLRRYAPEPAIATNLTRPFQLIDYQNDRLNRSDRLINLAGERKVKMDPAVTAGFPEYNIENPNPELLWGQLSLVDGILRASIEAGVTSISSVAMSDPVLHPVPAGSHHQLIELPLRIELVGNLDSVSRLLGIALVDEPTRVGLKLPAIDGLPGLCLQRILARLDSAETTGRIRLVAEFNGFLRLSTNRLAGVGGNGN